MALWVIILRPVKPALFIASVVLVAAGCSTEEPKVDAEGTGPTQQFVGQADSVELRITNNDTKTFPRLAVEFEQSAWTIQNVQPNGESLGDNTYRVGSIAPGETINVGATIIAHTPGNQTLTLTVYGDARDDGTRADYIGTLDLEIAVLP